MIYKVADNITSPLGVTTEQNYQAVMAGNSALHSYPDYMGIQEPLTASLFSKEQKDKLRVNDLSWFESLAVSSVKEALNHCGADFCSGRTAFILSSTKGNVELLIDGKKDESVFLGASAKRIIKELGIEATPMVVCNACISGLSALVLALRLLENGSYDYAIVCGCDCQGRFVISGFQSFKALSELPCRPFDMDRTGLNLGEAAATMILSRIPTEECQWGIKKGCVRNDGYHISAPSKKGDGAYLALKSVISNDSIIKLATVNAHGTATMFNDQMESVAIERAGLASVPVCGLKGYFGHTMGAAGILETIVTMRSLDAGVIPATKGFEELGVSGKICVSAETLQTQKRDFVKMISGFGGCNATIWCTRETEKQERQSKHCLKPIHHVTISSEKIVIDGCKTGTHECGKEILTEVYKRDIGDYPKFYKMDMLSRLGFVASELLLRAEKGATSLSDESRAIILFNRTSSIDSDMKYLESIVNPDDYYPSPALFVYTLPNIVTGEIAIRNGYHGETSFYVLPHHDEETMNLIVEASCLDKDTRSVITGWIDYPNEKEFIADLYLKVVEEP